jgi:D-sedoheptulose 7-phosphate isomerase
VLGISTSGTSPNIIYGFQAAAKLGAFTIGLSGQNGFSKFQPDAIFKIKSQVTARIQESHILIGHLLCGVVEQPYV